MYSPQIFAQIKNKKINKVSLASKIDIKKAPELLKAFSSPDLQLEVSRARKILVTGFFKEFVRMICADCKAGLNCPSCQSEVYSDSSGLCLKCHKPSSLVCPSCHGTSLRPSGFSLSKIKNEVEKSFEAKTSLAPDNQERITICSLKDLDSLKPIYDIAIFPYFDIYNQFPVLNLKFELLRKMRGLPDLGINKIFILTKNNNLFADQVVRNEWEKITLNELRQRKIEEMPPFTRYFETEQNDKYIQQIQELIPEKIIQKGEDSYVAFLPHELVLKVQKLFASGSIKSKARFDSPDFS